MKLSGAQKSALTSSWKTLAPDNKTMQNNGCLLFSLLFKTFPDTQGYFSHFKGTFDEASMKGSGIGRAHAVAVFSGLGAFVGSLEDQECMDGLSLKLARNHIDRKIGGARFGQMRQVFGGFLDQAMGGGASADVKGAWDAFLACLQSVLESEESKK